MSHCPAPRMDDDPGPCVHCGSGDWTMVTKHYPRPLIVFKPVTMGDWITRYLPYHAHCEYEANEQGKFRRIGGPKVVPQDKHTVRNRVAKTDERKAKVTKRLQLTPRKVPTARRPKPAPLLRQQAPIVPPTEPAEE